MAHQVFVFSKTIPVKTTTGCIEVLLSKQRDDEGDDYVQIIAWHKNAEGEFFSQEESVIIDEFMIPCFIMDFSEASAQRFVQEFQF
jgi:hypothetical protein